MAMLEHKKICQNARPTTVLRCVRLAGPYFTVNDTRKPFRKLSLRCINHRTQTRSRVNFKPWHSNLCSKFCAIHCRGLDAGCYIADLKGCSRLQFWIVWLAHSV